MVSLIVQNEFLEDLFLLSNNNNNEIDSFIKFIQHELYGYRLICDFEKIEEYIKASEENPIWELIADKTSSISFNKNLKEDLKNSNFYNSIGEHNIVLTTNSKNDVERLMTETGYAFFSIDNIDSEWPKFRSCRNGLQFKITNDNIIPTDARLDCWSKLSKYSTPLNSIVIFDKFIMKDKSNQKMKDNLYPFLELLTKQNKTTKPIQITIISEFDNDCIKEKHKGVIDYLKSKGIDNIALNIIKHHKAFYPADFEGLHSRFVLTNYFHYKCDDSFNFFKSNGKINNDADLRINFNLVKKNQHFFQKEVKDLKYYISKIKNDQNCPLPQYRLMYYPDNQNYLLN